MLLPAMTVTLKRNVAVVLCVQAVPCFLDTRTALGVGTKCSHCVSGCESVGIGYLNPHWSVWVGCRVARVEGGGFQVSFLRMRVQRSLNASCSGPDNAPPSNATGAAKQRLASDGTPTGCVHTTEEALPTNLQHWTASTVLHAMRPEWPTPRGRRKGNGGRCWVKKFSNPRSSSGSPGTVHCTRYASPVRQSSASRGSPSRASSGWKNAS